MVVSKICKRVNGGRERNVERNRFQKLAIETMLDSESLDDRVVRETRLGIIWSWFDGWVTLDPLHSTSWRWRQRKNTCFSLSIRCLVFARENWKSLSAWVTLDPGIALQISISKRTRWFLNALSIFFMKCKESWLSILIKYEVSNSRYNLFFFSHSFLFDVHVYEVTSEWIIYAEYLNHLEKFDK